jgi:peptidoglycan/LPS O-acetylase OafA/YrhL
MGDCRVKYLEKKMWAILKPFQRVTHGRGLLPEIDGLRFVAIISVVFFHLDVQMWARYPLQLKEDFASIALHEFLLLGNFGVPLFFAISGFFLSR